MTNLYVRFDTYMSVNYFVVLMLKLFFVGFTKPFSFCSFVN